MSYTTTSYGTWSSLVNTYETSPEDGINAYLGDADPTEYDMDAIYAAYRQAIDDALPADVSLCGNEFIGPAYPEAGEHDDYPQGEDGALDIGTIIEDLDFDTAAAFERYELYTLDSVGQHILESKAANPAKAAAATMSRLGLKPFVYRPHPNSGRPQAWYRVGDVKDALAARPGQGTRSDLKDGTA
jgi:hypothetical protein